MRCALALTALLICTFIARADDPLQLRYAAVEAKMSEAASLESKNDFAGARKGFLDSYAMLMRIRTIDSTWQPGLVNQQLNYCLDGVRQLGAKIAQANPAAPGQAAVINQAAVATMDGPLFAPPKQTSHRYPFKTGIVTTIFWIGEDSSHASAWNENWTKSNRGADDPGKRNGFATSAHASSVNPFYVALPFNDLAHPDKAHDWVPRSWNRPDIDGKPISACKDRWVCIKNASGRICYAQWEDVGPNGNDHAEYVFGPDRPSTGNRAGLDVSPAVAQYLGHDGNSSFVTSWRFVDDEDVPPGQWLKYDEQAVIYTALHQLQKPDHGP